MYSYLVCESNFIIRTDKVVRLSPISLNDRFTFTSFDRAKLAIDLRINFPERVRGNALTAAAVLKDAMGPIKFLTRATNSSLICFSFLIASTETDTWYYQQDIFPRYTHFFKPKSSPSFIIYRHKGISPLVGSGTPTTAASTISG